jgi:hypothetical protein
VLSVTPQALAEVTDLGTTIRIQFNERISERTAAGLLEEAVVVSPEWGEVDVEHKRDALEVKVSGGLRPGMAYRVTVLPVVRDMFNNRLRDPFEFVFSTGGTLHPNAVVGMVIDRLTGRPVRDLLVQAKPSTDTTIVYPTRTDSIGSYALRYLPPGAYSLMAFQDRNRNRTPDAIELQSRGSFQITAADTLFLNFAVLEGDTTPPRLTRADVVGPSLVQLRFDDFLDPEASLAQVGTALRRLDDPQAASGVRQLLHEHRFLAVRAAADSSAAPTPGQRTAAPGPGGYVGRATGTDSAMAALLDLTLPSQVVYAELGDTLPFDVEHMLRIQGVTNVAGVVGGPDSVQVLRPAPPMTPPAPPRPPGPGSPR